MIEKHERLPVARAEDVEFSEESADREDKTARERAEAADRRAVQERGE